MKIYTSIALLLIGSFALTACNKGPSDAEKFENEKIEKMKSIVKGILNDGESAQFSDMKYYKSTNFGCGFVNAKNKFGGYVGNKKFIVSLEEDLAVLDPEMLIPDAPKMPAGAYSSISTAMNFDSDHKQWFAESMAIQDRYRKFNAFVSQKCVDTSPPKEAK